MFQIAADGKAVGPVYAVNAAGIAENLSDLLAYSAPAVLELKKNSTGSVMAYFGSNRGKSFGWEAEMYFF